jgi:hypothetical protein
MVMIEMRDSLYDTAFDLLDEAKLNAKKTKLTLCELENAMYDCYESIKEEDNSEDDKDMKFRGVSGYKEDYRHDEQYGVSDDEEEAMLNRRMSHRRRNMRMRRRLV